MWLVEYIDENKFGDDYIKTRVFSGINAEQEAHDFEEQVEGVSIKEITCGYCYSERPQEGGEPCIDCGAM